MAYKEAAEVALVSGHGQLCHSGALVSGVLAVCQVVVTRGEIGISLWADPGNGPCQQKVLAEYINNNNNR